MPVMFFFLVFDILIFFFLCLCVFLFYFFVVEKLYYFFCWYSTSCLTMVCKMAKIQELTISRKDFIG